MTDGPLFVDVRAAETWREATIPGAVRLGAYDYFIPQSDEAGVADAARGAAAAFAAVGIDGTRETVYFEQATGMISPRALWFHELLRLPRGRILDGGIDGWDGPLAPGTGPEADIVSGVAGPPVAIERSLIATLDEVLDRDPARTILLDVRRRSEFEGTFVHPCCARPGRIPGAAFLFWEDLLHEGRYRPAAEIAAAATAAGLSPDRRIVTYCHRGARAATALYALRRAGYRDVGIFVGSWHEWAGRTDLPLEIGGSS